MNKLKTICLFVLLSISFNGIYAQQEQMTAYERRKAELISQIPQRFGQNAFRFVINTLRDDLSDENIFAHAEAAEIATALIGSRPYHQAMIWLANELRNAQGLRTAVDVQREREARERREQAKIEEKARAEREAFLRTDAGNIQRNIQIAFEQWNQRGEFEREADYLERLALQSQAAFDAICLEQIRRRQRFLRDRFGEIFRRELSAYNPDDEFFIISFRGNEVEWQSRINIPISEAEEFRNRFRGLFLIVNEYDWSFVGNHLVPTTVTLRNNVNGAEYVLPVTIPEQREILFSFDDFGIDNPYLRGYVFRLSVKAEQMRLQQEVARLQQEYEQEQRRIQQEYEQELLRIRQEEERVQREQEQRRQNRRDTVRGLLR